VTDNLEKDVANPLTELLVVANRLPFCRIPGSGTDQWQPSPGGLASTLMPPLREHRGTRLGWTGDVGAVEPFSKNDICCKPLELSPFEVEGFYEGFSNRTLWPLYHDAWAYRPSAALRPAVSSSSTLHPRLPKPNLTRGATWTLSESHRSDMRR